jgi:hypothetical protein
MLLLLLYVASAYFSFCSSFAMYECGTCLLPLHLHLHPQSQRELTRQEAAFGRFAF